MVAVLSGFPGLVETTQRLIGSAAPCSLILLKSHAEVVTA